MLIDRSLVDLLPVKLPATSILKVLDRPGGGVSSRQFKKIIIIKVIKRDKIIAIFHQSDLKISALSISIQTSKKYI